MFLKRNELIAAVTEGFDYTDDRTGIRKIRTTIRSRLVGSHLWLVLDFVQLDGDKFVSPRIRRIACNLLTKTERGVWDSVEVDELQFYSPVDYDPDVEELVTSAVPLSCPLEFFKLVPDSRYQVNHEWRSKVEAWHRSGNCLPRTGRKRQATAASV